MIYTKKGISPVVATSLLIVVAVVAILGFSNWNNQYQSTLQSDVEVKGKGAGGAVKVEYIGNDGTLYVSNSYDTNQTMDSIKVGSVDCNLNEELGPGVTQIDISSCLNQTGTNDIVIVTDSGVYEQSVFVDETPTVISFSFLGNKTVDTTYDYSLSIRPSGVGIDSLGNFAFGGDSSNLIVKFDNDVNELWNRTFDFSNSTYIYAVTMASNGDVFAGSEVSNSSGGDDNCFVARFDGSDGTELWNSSFADPVYGDWAVSFEADSSDNVYVACESWAPTNNFFVYKVDGSDGSLIWNTSRYSFGSISLNDLALDSSNNVYVAVNDMVFKFDSSGNFLWNQTYFPALTGIDVDGSNNLYVTGYNNSNYATLKLSSSDGSVIWQAINTSGLAARDIVTNDGGDSYIIGNIDNSDVSILKYDTNGNLLWSDVINENWWFFNYGQYLAIDHEDNLIAFGVLSNNARILKYD